MLQELEPQRSGQIARQLREDILCGRLSEGLRLTETGLAKRFGVGRGLIREALQQLCHQGLLVARPNCGAAVAPEPPKPIREVIVPIRRTLEAYALQQVFHELGDKDFRRWDELLERMHDACVRRDYQTIAETDIAFHRSIVKRTGQPDLLAIWEAMAYRIRSHFQRTQRRCPDLMAIYEEHRAIVEGIRSGDCKAALKLLEEKIA